MLPRVKAAIAAEESRKLSARIRSKHAELMEQGAPSGGGRPFGLTTIKRDANGRTYRELVPDEAEAIRQAARDIIEGVSVKGVCRRWEAQGLRGTRGRRITPQVVTRIMTAEWVVGRRGGAPCPMARHPGRPDLAPCQRRHQGQGDWEDLSQDPLERDRHAAATVGTRSSVPKTDGKARLRLRL